MVARSQREDLPASVRSAETSAPAVRPRAAHLGPTRRRPQILDVAFGLFIEHGYKGTTMEAIAQVAGVSKPVVYDCFPSKAHLFAALLDREERRMLERFSASLAAGASQGDLSAMLTAGFTSVLRAVAERPSAYRIALLGSEDGGGALDARIRRSRDYQIDAIAGVARRWLDGRIPDERLETSARFVGHMLMGIGEAGTRMMLTEPDRWDPDTLARQLAEMAMRGFASLR